MSAAIPFGPYELVRRLGSGGMAETFLAVKRGPAGFEQHVCVKRILPAFEEDPDLVRQFMEEARLAAQLRHANITQVVDFGVASGSHYLALELVDGMDLRTLLRSLRERGRTLDPMLAVFLATEISAALEFAHTAERGRHAVIHRDISPSNILVSRAGEVYLTDFGVARALGVKRITASGVVRGKVPYMAPEYALKATFDARSDLFALGVVIYEAIAGKRPFEGATELDTLQKIKEGKHQPLAELCPSAPSSLVSIVEQLLSPDPEERFQRAAALQEALAHVAPPPTAHRQLGELVRELRDSSADTEDLERASTTSAMAMQAPPVSYPDVMPAPPDVATRTSEAGVRADRDQWSSDPPKETWSSTDPAQVSHHDRASPPVHVAVQPAPSFSPAKVPITRTRNPVIVPKKRVPWLLLAVLGVIAFAAAGVCAYYVVSLLVAPGA